MKRVTHILKEKNLPCCKHVRSNAILPNLQGLFICSPTPAKASVGGERVDDAASII